MAIGPVSPNSLAMAPAGTIDGPSPFRPTLPEQERLEKTSPFQTLFEETISQTNQKLVDAETKAKEFAEGKTDDIHGTMIAVSEADIQLRLLGTMKNKVVEAFYELWRMQI